MKIFKVQKSLAILYTILSVAFFVTALGFMTSYFDLYVYGTDEMYEFYERLQVFNHNFLNQTVIFIIISLLLFAFDVNKKRLKKTSLLICSALCIYTSVSAISYYQIVVKYKDIYSAFDFSNVSGYLPSVLAFDATIALSLLLVIVPILLVVSMALTTLKKQKD